jgi:hypothetical protein
MIILKREIKETNGLTYFSTEKLNEPLDQKELQLIKENRVKEDHFYKTLKGVLIQLVFLTLLYNVANLNQDPNSYKYQDSLNKLFLNGFNSEAIQFDEVIINLY